MGHNCNGEREEHLACLPSKRPHPSGSSAQLLQPRVFRLGFLQDGNIRVGIPPQREEGLLRGVSCEAFRGAKPAVKVYTLRKRRETFDWINELTMMLVQVWAVHT